MAFIDKKDPVVLNIKLTSKGRELLSEGNLNFKYFAIGDSEIDYAFNKLVGDYDKTYTAFKSHILRPADKNPSLLSFIPRNLDGDPYNIISTVPSIPTIIQNTAQPLGFFNITEASTTFITDSDHVKQPDAMVKINLVSGGTKLAVFKASTYIANVNEPEIGDLILVKWTNPVGISTTGYTVNVDYPTPYLMYKIQDIISGKLATNNLIVEVDRELPNFNGLGSNVQAGALIYYNYINFSGTSIYNDYSTDYVSDAVTAFLQNCQCPTIIFPFWNMSIIYTDEIAGVQSTDRNYGQFNTKSYGGFVSYIQNQSPVIKKLGVIHYTNSSPSNTYAEELYQNTPVLDIPTIMWHKSSTSKMGAKFKAYGNVKTLTGITRSLNTTYYDLADLQGNIVGKIFNDLKLFVIEDQELLFAMSYKSNRSWTLPNYSVGINDNVTIGCLPCTLTYQFKLNSPTYLGGSDGSIEIYDIQSYFGDLVLEIDDSNGNIIYYKPITDVNSTIVGGLPSDIYTVSVYDLGSPNCVNVTTVDMGNPTSYLFTYDVTSTASGLDPNFKITQINPTDIKIFRSDIGTLYGDPYAIVVSYGTVPNTGISGWNPMTTGTSPNQYAQFNTLTFKSEYSIYIKDSSLPDNVDNWVRKDYVAAGNPLSGTFNMSQGSDGNGTYINVSNYMTTINPSVNPVLGIIEFAIYPTTPSSTPIQWQTLPSGSPLGSAIKLYYVGNVSDFTVSIRERLI